MANLNPGYYTFEVHYKSPVAINMPAGKWQTAILQVMWFEDAYAVSDGIKCYPTPTTINAYGATWGLIRDLEAILHLPSNRTVISAYQFSADIGVAVPQSHVVTTLNVDGCHHNSATSIKGNNAFLDLHGMWAQNTYSGPHYFNLQYRTPIALSFTDCKEKYNNNKNIYAMMLPPSCTVSVVHPKTTFSLPGSWSRLTDVIYSFTLSRKSHVIIMYQYTGHGGNSHVIMRLSVDSVAQQHTTSLTGNTAFVGNFGLWQGSLDSGAHKVTFDYRSPVSTTNTVSSDLEWKPYNKWMTRAMIVIVFRHFHYACIHPLC